VKLLQITDVRVFPVESQKNMIRAYATVTFEDELVVRDVRVIEGKNGLFLSMPARRKRNGEFQDICFPLTAEFRKTIETAVLGKYTKEVA